MLPYLTCPFAYINRMNVPTTLSLQPQAIPHAITGTPAIPATPAVTTSPTTTQPPVNYVPPVISISQIPAMLPLCPFQPYMMPGMGNMGDMADMADMSFSPSASSPGDPPPVLSNSPAVPTIALFKELTGYPNYGNPSGNADILYTGNRGVWTFDLPPFLSALGNLRAQILIRAVLDDHGNVPVRQYSARITINGRVVHNGPVPLEHGVPTGGRFTNWKNLQFSIDNLRRNNRIEIVNTSTAGPNDWIALDWMEMRFFQR